MRIEVYAFEFLYLCSKGEVRINWNPISKNNTTLKTDDMVSVSGRGRLKVSS
jgi:RNA-binding protein YlmH